MLVWQKSDFIARHPRGKPCASTCRRRTGAWAAPPPRQVSRASPG